MRRVSTTTIKKRLVTVFLFGFLIFMVIVIRLGYVQFIIGEELTSLAEESWTRDITFEAERGLILDRNNEVLAENVTAPSIILAPRQIDDPQDTAGKLAQILDITTEKAYDYVTKDENFVRVHPEGRKISNQQEKTLRTLGLNGVYLAKDSKRHYPYGKNLAHVLGFTGIDNQGLMGLERHHDNMLNGKQGSLSIYSDAKGGKLDHFSDEYKAPKDGLDLQTTIDSKVQTIMERELDLAMAEYQPDNALAIGVDPNTGEVLGMTSRPNFSPENYLEYDSEIYDRNLPIWQTFEPGSTFKIITLAATLEEDLVDLNDDHFHDHGSVTVDGAKMHCWKSGGHGEQTYLEVVQNSCNPGFVDLGQKIGKEKLFTYIKDFGFGEKTGIDLQGEGNGILFKPENVGAVELATTSFGQGVSVTPIQQVMAVSAAVNGGYLYEPFIAKKWVDPQTSQIVEEKQPKLKKQVISKKTSDEVSQTLESVVAEGTGRPAYVEGYRVGGKTGTAQKVGTDGTYLANDHIVSFIGMAPANDPKIVVLVAIDNPKDTIQFGGVVAGPIVGTIIEDSLSAMGIGRQEEGLDKEYQYPEQPKVEVPNLIGQTKDDLMEVMTNLSLEANGTGDYIVKQSPEAGTKVEEDSTVRIYFSSEEKE